MGRARMLGETAVLLLIAAAGGCGAMLRYAIGTWLTRPHTGRQQSNVVGVRALTNLPWALMVVNLSGSVLAGGMFGVALGLPDEHDGVAVVTAGVLGGFTTFSAVSQETVALLRQRRWCGALMVGPGQLLLGWCGAVAGWALATWALT